MRNPYKKIVLVFVFLFIFIALTITCLAVKSQEDYHELFIYAAQADGAYAEGASDRLARAFKNDAQAFVAALALEEETVQKRNVSLLVYNPEHTYDDLLSYVEQLSTQSNWNEAEAHIFHLLRTEISVAQTNLEDSSWRIFDVFSGIDPLKLAGVLGYIERNYISDAEVLLSLIAQLPEDRQPAVIAVTAHLVYPIDPKGYEEFFTGVCNSDTHSPEEKNVAQQLLAQTDSIYMQQIDLTTDPVIPGNEGSTVDPAWYVAGVLLLFLLGQTGYILYKRKKWAILGIKLGTRGRFSCLL